MVKARAKTIFVIVVLLSVLFVRAARPRGRPPRFQCGRRIRAPAPDAGFTRGSGRRLAPDIWFALNFLGDSLEISRPRPGMEVNSGPHGVQIPATRPRPGARILRVPAGSLH